MKKLRVLATLVAVMLTAELGRIEFQGHDETWYNLPMQKVVSNAMDNGIVLDYWVRDDGVKMFGQWVIVAAHPKVTRYSLVETSLGQGIVLDRHTAGDTELYDIATDWKE